MGKRQLEAQRDAILRTVRRLMLTSTAISVLGIALAVLGHLVLGIVIAAAGIAIFAVPWAIGWWGDYYLRVHEDDPSG
jgi:hypothetical protein